MATKVVMEALSPTMEEGRLVAWKKKEGDPVKSGETLAEVETDKAVMDLVARADGVLRKIVLQEGATVPVSALVAIIGGADEDISALAGGTGSTGARGHRESRDRDACCRCGRGPGNRCCADCSTDSRACADCNTGSPACPT